MPSLRGLHLGRLWTLPRNTKSGNLVESLIPNHQCFRITKMSHLQQLSLEWMSHGYGTGSQDEQVAFSVTKDTNLSVVASGDFAELSISAPRATSLAVGECSNVAQPTSVVLDIDCPLLKSLVMRGWGAATSSWRKELGRTACKKCPLLEKVKWEAVGPNFERYRRIL